MSNDVKEGTYKATVFDYSMQAHKNVEGKADSPGTGIIMFKFKDEDGDTHDITHYLYFSPLAAPWSVKTLVLLGFKGDKPEALAKGKGSGILDENKVVELVTKWETWVDKSTGEEKGKMKVAYINEVGAAKFKDLMDSKEAALKFHGMDFGADFAQARAERGSNGVTPAAETGAVKNHAPTGADPSEEIPF